MDHSNRLFRKAVFGGFNKDDVIDYIESMKNEFFEYRKQVETTINELNQKISELESAGADVEKAEPSASQEEVAGGFAPVGTDFTDNVNLSVGEINEATEHLKKTADKLCESLTEFMDRISTSCISVTVEAPVHSEEDTAQAANSPAPEVTQPTEEAATPSAEEIADAYRQAIEQKGEAVLADAFGNEKPETDSGTTHKPSDNSSFSELLNSILNATPSDSDNSGDEQDDKPEEKSMIDDILSSGAFFN